MLENWCAMLLPPQLFAFLYSSTVAMPELQLHEALSMLELQELEFLTLPFIIPRTHWPTAKLCVSTAVAFALQFLA